VGPFELTSIGMKARTAGLLCYLFGWVGGLVFLLLERDNRFVRVNDLEKKVTNLPTAAAVRRRLRQIHPNSGGSKQ